MNEWDRWILPLSFVIKFSDMASTDLSKEEILKLNAQRGSSLSSLKIQAIERKDRR